MKLKKTPELLSFLTTYIADADAEADVQTTQKFAESAPADRRAQVITDLKSLMEEADLPVDEFGSEANRWFGDSEEARTWLGDLLGALIAGAANADTVIVKDSNGTVLEEGDSVQVIKDLKVKGGSSDLKRGTLIKKIHLIGDAGNIECRVDGSTLVLKTIFLKKV